MTNKPMRLMMALLCSVSLSGCYTLASQPPATRAVDLTIPPAMDIAPTLDRVTPSAESLLWPDDVRFLTDVEKTRDSYADLAADGALELTPESAVITALSRNRALAVEQFRPTIAGTFVQTERAVFDPVLFAEGRVSRDTERSFDGGTGRFFSIDGRGHAITAGAEQLFPTGTTLAVDITQSRRNTDRTTGIDQTRAGLNLTQAILRGGNIRANMASLHQAEAVALASSYNLRGFAESLVASVENAYWDYALARRQIEIFQESAALAELQLEETRARITVGQLAETEEAAANAELALRQQQLIDARNNAEKARLSLLRLLNVPSPQGWERDITIADDAVIVPEVSLGNADEHEALALRLRPDLNEARLQARQGELETIQTANGLLPRLDLFLNMGKTGYAQSVGSSISDLDGSGYDFTGGLRMEMPYGNRAARAADRRARAGYQQALQSIENMRQLVSLDVRTALLEVERSLQQIDAIAARRVLQEEILRAESERFRVGNATALDVSRAQRDLLESQISEVEAIVNYRKALTDLYRLDGTLLIRRGIQGPGDEEVLI